MKRTIVLLLFCTVLCALPVRAVDVAGEQAREFGLDALEEGLAGSAADLPDGCTPYDPGDFGEGAQKILGDVLAGSGPPLRAALRTAVSIMAVVLLSAVVTQMDSVCSRRTVLLAGALTIALLSVGSVRSMIGLGRETMQELQSFTALLLPVLASATAAGGGAGAGSAIYAGTVFVTNILAGLINRLLMPLLYVYLALGTANAVLGEKTLERLQAFCRRLITFSLKGVVFLFTAYLSLSGLLASSGDSLAMKAAKLTVSSAVPVVGGMLSDASATVLLSAQTLKNAVGVFGMLAVLAICLAPLIRIGLQAVVLRLTAAACGAVGDASLIGLIETAADAMSFLVGMTGAGGFMLLISCVSSVRAVTP